jgi:hypothetical protein
MSIIYFPKLRKKQEQKENKVIEAIEPLFLFRIFQYKINK